MTDWNRKTLCDLGYVISRCRMNATLTPNQREQLALVAEAAHNFERNVKCTDESVDSVRDQLCTVCRKESLYTCDRASGWSNKCQLVRVNSDSELGNGNTP